VEDRADGEELPVLPGGDGDGKDQEAAPPRLGDPDEDAHPVNARRQEHLAVELDSRRRELRPHARKVERERLREEPLRLQLLVRRVGEDLEVHLLPERLLDERSPRDLEDDGDARAVAVSQRERGREGAGRDVVPGEAVRDLLGGDEAALALGHLRPGARLEVTGPGGDLRAGGLHLHLQVVETPRVLQVGGREGQEVDERQFLLQPLEVLLQVVRVLEELPPGLRREGEERVPAPAPAPETVDRGRPVGGGGSLDARRGLRPEAGDVDRKEDAVVLLERLVHLLERGAEVASAELVLRVDLPVLAGDDLVPHGLPGGLAGHPGEKPRVEPLREVDDVLPPVDRVEHLREVRKLPRHRLHTPLRVVVEDPGLGPHER
jgi:hypothetical protein